MANDRRRKRKKFSRARAALAELADTLEFIFYRGRGHAQFAIEGQDSYREWKAYNERKEKQRQFYYLKRRGLIEAKKIGDRLMVRLTDKGYTQVLRSELRSAKGKCADGVCLVTFDIPESHKVARDAFRRLLFESDFQKLHHSVWFTEHAVCEPLLAFVKRNKLTPWVHIVVGKIVTGAPRPLSLFQRSLKK